MKFDAVAPNSEDAVVIPEGYQQGVVISWGDPILARCAEVRRRASRPAPPSAGSSASTTTSRVCCRSTGSPNRFLLVTNHEYVTPQFMFPGYNADAPTREQFDVEIARSAWASSRSNASAAVACGR